MGSLAYASTYLWQKQMQRTGISAIIFYRLAWRNVQTRGRVIMMQGLRWKRTRWGVGVCFSWNLRCRLTRIIRLDMKIHDCFQIWRLIPVVPGTIRVWLEWCKAQNQQIGIQKCSRTCRRMWIVHWQYRIIRNEIWRLCPLMYGSC